MRITITDDGGAVRNEWIIPPSGEWLDVLVDASNELELRVVVDDAGRDFLMLLGELHDVLADDARRRSAAEGS